MTNVWIEIVRVTKNDFESSGQKLALGLVDQIRVDSLGVKRFWDNRNLVKKLSYTALKHLVFHLKVVFSSPQEYLFPSETDNIFEQQVQHEPL